MRTTLISRALLTVALGAVAVIAPSGADAVNPNGDNNGSDAPGRDIAAEASMGRANFDGRTIDLQKSWEDAEACHVAQDLSVTCYRTEKEMDDTLGIAHRGGGDYPSQANGYSSCGSSLKMYKNSYYGTPVLYLTTRWSWTTLSWFGFDNQVSSYRVGSCSAVFKSGSYGSGSTYPGPTSAWNMRTSMGWYWDNVVSSTYMY